MTYESLCRPYPETIEELERKLEVSRQQIGDYDHAIRLKDTELRRLRSEASELMAENADKALLIADLRQQVAWHVENAKAQAEVIRDRSEAAARLEMMMWRIPYRKASKVERVKMILAALKPGDRLPGGLVVMPERLTNEMWSAASPLMDDCSGQEIYEALITAACVRDNPTGSDD
jgi:hypothetical protein